MIHISIRLALSLAVSLAVVYAHAAAPALSIEDAVSMVRIQVRTTPDGTVAAISTDGRKVAFVTWRGDLARALNVFTLWTVDVTVAKPVPVALLTWDGPVDAEDQVATPIADLTFLPDNKTLAFLGRRGNQSAQVWTLDTDSKQARQLTAHAFAVRSFVINPHGELGAFSAILPEENTAWEKMLATQGVFVRDTDLFPRQLPFFAAIPILLGPRALNYRQYFVPGQSMPFFDSRQSRPAQLLDQSDPRVASSIQLTLADDAALGGVVTLSGDPQGKRALLFPYALTGHDVNPRRYAYYEKETNPYVLRSAAPYGVVDLATGKIQRLLDAPHPQFHRKGGGDPLWLPDGRSVVIHTLLPEAPQEPPQWVQVELATRRVTKLNVPTGWRLLSWMEPGTSFLASNAGAFGKFSRKADGSWGDLTELSSAEGFSIGWAPATNGRIVVGVKERTTTPPELALYDLATKQTCVLTDLNPQLQPSSRTYGDVSLIHWENSFEKASAGFLIKPVGYQPGTRYPLVILMDDNTMRREGAPFLLDAVVQLSGHAIQMLAAQGYMVLYPRSPSIRDVVGTPAEGNRYCEYIENVIAKLDREGLIEPLRVGISGWSRDAYHTQYLLMHSKHRFAAASSIDGGSFEYTDRMRPFTDAELSAIHTPLLFEPHRIPTLAATSAMADRMAAMGKATEILYFHTAPHMTTQPQHRLDSLTVHLDWWNFWLKGEENPDPAKTKVFARWRKLRDMRDADLKKAAEQGNAATP